MVCNVVVGVSVVVEYCVVLSEVVVSGGNVVGG